MSIKIVGINKHFGAFSALRNINLELKSGELIALLGPSGCGKTTLLRIVAGLENADSGQVIIAGKDASNSRVNERRVGFVFQHYALFKHKTIFDNVAFGLRMKPARERPSELQIKQKVQQLLHLVQLDWLADRYPSQLSGGQRQRIALARALAVEPQVLLLDEPFGALDAKVRKELRRWLRKLHDELHITSVFVTHDQEEAMEVADRIVLMNQGAIEQFGSPEQIYEQPSSPFVYEFIGSVNRFAGSIFSGVLNVGDEYIPLRGEKFKNADNVVAFARPHELDIVNDALYSEGISAQVDRILPMGNMVKVELIPLFAAPEIHFEVHLPKDYFQRLKLHPNQYVRVLPKNLKFFPNEQQQYEVAST